MRWACSLTEDAEDDLRRLPRHIQERVARTLDSMMADPYQSNIRALKGREWQGVFRRRIGSYRILFTANQEERTFVVIRILIRSKDTYR